MNDTTSYNGPVYMNNGLTVGSTESESNIIFNNDVIINGSLTTNQGSVVINKATFKQESTSFEGTLTLNGRQVVTTDTLINDIGETTTSLENLTDRSLIVGGSIFVLSDERIKTNVSHIEDSVALNLFRKLQPKTYHYKDFFEKGTKKVFGYMAQEVKEILPHAVSLKTECIPNIYELATINDNTMEFHNFNTSELEVNASSQLYPKCKVYTKDNKEEYITIKEIIDEKRVLIENISSSWLEDINVSTGEIIEGNKLFIYGQEVDNFHTLNKNVIWTVASAALQEVDREVQTEKQKVSQLENKVSQLENTLQELLLRINTLEHK